MKAAVVVQARLSSTRLPGKVLLDLAGRPVLAHVLERCAAIPGIAAVVCAVPDTAADDPVAAAAAACGAVVVRGPEADVLERYRLAAAAVGAEAVLRVTSDCPLIDPAVCGQVLALVTSGQADFAANNFERTWPHGLDCEAFTTALLNRAAAEAAKPSEREHVGPWMRNHPDVRKANLANPDGDQHGHRWTVDHPVDMEFMRALFPALPAGPAGWSHRATMAAVAAQPGLAALNAGHDPLEGLRKSQAAEASLTHSPVTLSPITLRPATLADGQRMLDWRSLPEVRRFALTPEAPEPAGHWAWLRDRLARSGAVVAIIERRGRPAGVLRLDRDDSGTFTVSILVDPALHRAGVGRQALALARRMVPAARLEAVVLPANEASRRLFAAAGYVQVAADRWVSAPVGPEPAARVAIHADCGPGVGLGHVSRCLGLAQALQQRGIEPLLLLTPDDAAVAARAAQAGIAHRICDDVLAGAEGAGLLVLDSYRADALRLAAAFDGPLCRFEDAMKTALPAALTVNGSPAAEAMTGCGGVALAGPAYQILASPAFRRRAGAPRRLLVTYGGGDPAGLGPRLAALAGRFPDLAVDFVVGPYARPPALPGNAVLHHAPAGMAALIEAADLAVTAAGQTMIELVAAGVPAVAFATADNQRPNLDALARAGAVLAAPVDGLEAALRRLLADDALRGGLADKAAALYDHRGADRVASAVATQLMIARAARP